MASLRFDPETTLIVVEVKLIGKRPAIGNFVLDTGASYMMISWELALALGLKIDPHHTVKAATASAMETIPEVTIPEVSFLGKNVPNVKTMVKDLPVQSGVSGLLGLSFLKHFEMTIDFPNGKLTLK